MATNFFQRQHHARKRTGLLVLCFCASLVLMTALLYAVVMFLVNMVESKAGSEVVQVQYWNLKAFGGVAGLVILVVGCSSLFKIIQLRSGGRVVAEMLGAKPLNPETRNHKERVAHNVVEEMAIASGTPVPPVYILEDGSINAFAAGWSVNDAVVSLNRGTIEQLSRDELQGVVAHEFSHIFNGDMRINIRLIGVIHGLLVLGTTGWILMRYVGPALMGSGRRSSKDNGAAIGIGIMLFGLVLMICGFIGMFFGRLIQAAISRQREFLADASAVQYTRNPDGIGGALRKIQSIGRMSEAHVAEKASDISHMFFAKAMNSMFATHPPIAERIARVEGLSRDEVEEQLRDQPVQAMKHSKSTSSPTAAVNQQQRAKEVLGAVIMGSVVHDSLEKIGSIDEASLGRAKEIIQKIPESLLDAAHSMATARLVVICLILDKNEDDRGLQWNQLAKDLSESELRLAQSIEAQVDDLDPWARIPLLDLCIPSLSQLSEKQYKQFRELLDRLIRIDGSIDRWEWVVDTILDRHLEERYHKPGSERRARAKLTTVTQAVVTVIGTLACAGADDVKDARRSFEAAMHRLGWQANLPDPSTLGLRGLRGALKQLRKVRFDDRKEFLEACESCILQDGQTTVEEAETLRAIAESIDCPMPVLVP
ncbi:MAG: M48 family metallopeptidase [Phycisphaerales bacterium]|nr:M48 family metallopeptidase [Phycisphaerales bacterium]